MSFNHTKIVCTIGPASWDPKTLEELAIAGMNCARFNFSHGGHDEKADQMKTIRAISKKLNKPITIFADLQGPKIRLGKIEGTKEIKKGDKINLTLNPSSEEDLPMQYDLSPFVKVGHRVFLNDGLVSVKVLSVKGKVIYGEALNDGWVSSHKGVNIPDTRLKGYVFTPKDEEDAIFALQQKVDYLALSFIQSVEDLDRPRQLIAKYNPTTKIIVKVEKNEAVADLENIVKATDAVMVARGDLAIEAQAAEVPIVQQKIIKLGRQYQKPVIVATQMLESMIENPRPTRAEVSDVANAVLDQADAVMLSAESASGKYPIEAVTVMTDVIREVESHPDYKHYIKVAWENIEKEEMQLNAIAASSASLAYRIGAEVIVTATASGKMARRVAAFRPSATIVAVTHTDEIASQVSLIWGVKSIVITPTKDSDSFWKKITDKLLEDKIAKKGDKVVLTSGSTVGISGATDTVKIVTL